MMAFGGMLARGDEVVVERSRREQSRFAPCFWMTVVPWALVLATGLALMHLSVP